MGAFEEVVYSLIGAFTTNGLGPGLVGLHLLLLVGYRTIGQSFWESYLGSLGGVVLGIFLQVLSGGM